MTRIPHDLEAEESFLATLSAPGADDDAYIYLPLLSADDFVAPKHKAIYRALNRLVDTRTEITPLSIRDTLETMGLSQDAGGLDGVFKTLGAFEVGRPDQLAEIIRRHTLSRKLQKIGHHLHEEAGKGIHEPRELASRVSDALGKLDDKAKSNSHRGSEILDRLRNGEAFGPEGGAVKLMYFGVPDLDYNIEAAPGHVVVIGARPKCGKSAFMIQAVSESLSRGVPTLVVSLEMDRDEVEARQAAWVCDVDYLTFRRGGYRYDDVAEKAEAFGPYLDNLHTFIGSSGTAFGTIEAEIRDKVRREGVRLVCVDYLQLVKHTATKSTTLAAALGEVSQKFKRLAQELRICVCLLAQINREGGKGTEPSVEDLKGSGDIEQDANAIVLLWRNQKDETCLKIAANRSGPNGFRQVMDFNGATSRWVSAGRIVDGATVPQLGNNKAAALLQKKPKTVDFLAGMD